MEAQSFHISRQRPSRMRKLKQRAIIENLNTEMDSICTWIMLNFLKSSIIDILQFVLTDEIIIFFQT
uniref:Uncharacterized protein n=1 Tax=Picea sitchensis TaxID=3332 RepID=A9P2Q2_PICSI|nr:unknown [Picea sitchensis]